MQSKPVQGFIEESVANLAAISQRRNALLQEMHQMMRRRSNFSQFLGYDDEDREDLKEFLQRFAMTADDFETGSIRNLDDSEFPLDVSLSHQASDIAKQTRSRQMRDSITAPPGSHLDHSNRTSTSRNIDADVTMVDSHIPEAPPRKETIDNEDDELDLFKASPTSPIPSVKPGHFRPESISLVTEAAHPPLSVLVTGKPQQVPPLQFTVSKPMPQSQPPYLVSASEGEVDRSHALSNSGSLVKSPPSASHDSLQMVSVSPKKPIVVVSDHLSSGSEPGYIFLEPPTPKPTPATPKELSQRQYQFQPGFTLPPLKSINPDLKKSKVLKRRKEKERDGGNKEGRKEDWAPLGLNKWAATLSANPVWKKVSRASKCLTTREWAVAMSELRLIRAIDRIELLKREGRWSFRQPKKQRTIGGVTKTHWDHLLDEMKWMRVDFREERKWKLALAYNISTDVLDWHAAGSTEVRLAKGICVRWRRASHERASHEMVVDDGRHCEESAAPADMETETEEHQHQEAPSLLGIDYGSEDDEDDDEDDDDDHDSQDVTDALEPSTLVALALEDTERKDEPQQSCAPNVQPKTEETEDPSSLIKQEPLGDSMQSDVVMDDVRIEAASGLKATSNDPVLTSQPTPSSNGGDTDTVSSTPLKPGKSNLYAPFREIIAYSESDKLFLDLEELDLTKLNVSAKASKESTLSTPGLESIFPDLHIMDFDLTPVIQGSDGKKKTEKKSDRDDPNKRSDDILYTRLYPTGKFMISKPTLIGPLRPSKNWKNGQWLALDDSAVVPESDVPLKNDDSACDLFDSRSSSGPSLIALQLQTAFMKDKDIRRRPDHLWTSADDTLLKSHCDRYPNNWALISECFNASRLTISTDKRTPRDCFDRWREKWGPETRRLPETTSAVEATPPPTSTQMTTRGVKRLASASVSSVTAGAIPSGSEPRKKRRHALVLDTIKKAGKKRADAVQKAQLAQRKTPGIHETHAQISKLPKRTPAELSRVKAEKEQEMQNRKKQEEMNRIRMAQGQSAQQTIAQQAPQPQPQPQPQPVPAMQRPTGTGMPPQVQVMPQIRNQVNISQQQRANTPAMQANRLNQQHLLQVRAVQQQQQQQQHALAHAQNQIQANGVVGVVNGTVPATNPRLSPSYVTRDVALSVSPPHNSAVASAVNSPRPPSAQAQIVAHSMPLQVTGNQGTRGTYYLPNLPNGIQGYTTEQLQTALRQHQQQQQQAQQSFNQP